MRGLVEDIIMARPRYFIATQGFGARCSVLAPHRTKPATGTNIGFENLAWCRC